jgi:hypothetical protein
MKFLKRWAQTTKTVEEGWSRCFKKHYYSTFNLAKDVAIRRMNQENIKLYAYLCPICSHYHLTTKKYDSSIEIGGNENEQKIN